MCLEPATSSSAHVARSPALVARVPAFEEPCAGRSQLRARSLLDHQALPLALVWPQHSNRSRMYMVKPCIWALGVCMHPMDEGFYDNPVLKWAMESLFPLKFSILTHRKRVKEDRGRQQKAPRSCQNRDHWLQGVGGSHRIRLAARVVQFVCPSQASNSWLDMPILLN